jgi:hypothetical protein
MKVSTRVEEGEGHVETADVSCYYQQLCERVGENFGKQTL